MQKENEINQGRHSKRNLESRLVNNNEILNQIQDDHSCKGGFTLIELLVVVLIIGILAAVALPQYNKAVLKARVTEIQNFYNAAEKALELYVLENPGKDLSLIQGLADELSIDFSNFGNVSGDEVIASSGYWKGRVYVNSGKPNIILGTMPAMGGAVWIYSGDRICNYTSATDKGKDICQAFVAGRSGWTVELGS